MGAKRMRTSRQQLIEEPATLADRTANGAGADAEPARELALEEGDLNARLKAKGMYSIDEMMGNLPIDKWRVHSGMTDLTFFGEWLERKSREYLTMKAAYDVGDKDESDELYEWVLAHYGAFHDVLVNFRAALSSQDHADAGKVEGDGPTACVGEMQTSSGADYYVCVKVGDREITPHMFKERWKAEYEVAEWLWLFNGGDKPDLLAYGPLPSAPASEGAE